MSLPFDNIDDSETIANEDAAETAPQPNNRIFVIAAAVLGGIIILALACIMIYAVFLQPAQKRAQESASQTAAADQAQAALALSVSQTETADKATKDAVAAMTANAPKATPSPVPPTATRAAASAVTATPVVALAVTATKENDISTPDLTQTVSALITQGANAQKTVVPTSTGLPKSGFAEDVGLPGLLGLAVVLIVVIFLTRRLRS